MREIVRARYVRLEFNGRDVWNISEISVAEKRKDEHNAAKSKRY